VVAAEGGQNPEALRLQPPEELLALASAAGTLVGASSGKLWVLISGPDGSRRWQKAARWDPGPWSAQPLRAASYGQSAVVWMRGKTPGTVAAALEVTAQGQVIQQEVSVLLRSLGGIWQSSHAPAGRYDPSFPEPVRLLVAQVRMSGALSREELLHSERSPWGGRLVAPELGSEPRDGWRSAPLLYVGASSTSPVPLEYADEPLLFGGLIGYGAASQLYVDGRWSRRGAGVLVVDPPGSRGQGGGGQRGRPLRARLVPGLRPPCAIVGSDWHE
jgi:hypothetical protein